MYLYAYVEIGSNIVEQKGSVFALKALAEQLNIHSFVRRSPGLQNMSPKMLATVMEAIIGAVWLDSRKNNEPAKSVARSLRIID